MPLLPKEQAEQGYPSRSSISTILWESVWEAFTNAILVTIFGSVILGIVGGLWHELAPSMPPGFGHDSHIHHADEGSPVWSHVESSLKEHRFVLIFGVMFLLTCRARLAERSAAVGKPTSAAWSRRVVKRVSKEWFSLIINNAFGAMVSAMVVAWSQGFTWTQWLWSQLFGSFISWLLHLEALVLGSEQAGNIQAWIDWYGQNHFKFTFWFLYLAAIGDDLGIPNFKTLGRWLWRKLRNRLLPVRSPAPPIVS